MSDAERHPDAVDLAEYAEELLDESRRRAVEDHIRECADCAMVLADLAAVPDLLAHAPLPPLPDDVATRLDRAIAAEADARASDWSGTAAQATPIHRTRRWLAPLAAAAAVIAVVALAIPVLNDSDNDTDTSSDESAANSAEQRSAEDEAGAPSKERAPAAAVPSEPVSLSSANFGQDVINAFYSGENVSVLERSPLAAESDSRAYYESQLGGHCPVDDMSTTSVSEVVRIVLDGRPAYLLLNHADRLAEAVAFACDGPKANLLASASLRLR